MASINFPDSPSDGDTFTSGNSTYTYVASKTYWDAQSNTSGIQLTSLSMATEGTPINDGQIAYDNTTGVFTYNPPDLTRLDFPGKVVTVPQLTELSSTKNAASGVVAHNLETSAVFVHSSISSNFTVNATNVPTTDNRTTSIALVLNQGATAYVPTAFQIDGSAQTILWQSGDTPAGENNGLDIVSFTLIRSGGAWLVLGSLGTYSAL